MGKNTNVEVNTFEGHRKAKPYLVRGLNRVQAAGYIGVGRTLFDEMAEDGRMPKPIYINTKIVWDLRLVDDAFDDLGSCEVNPWDRTQ
jgi:hypothetical protein